MHSLILLGSDRACDARIQTISSGESIAPYNVIRFEESLKIADVHALIGLVKVSLPHGQKRLIVTSASITLPAQHALLKMLEELPEHNIFVMVGASLKGLLDTIISRCQVVYLDQEALNVQQIPVYTGGLLSAYATSKEEVEMLILSLRAYLHEHRNAEDSSEVFQTLKTLHARYQFISENNFNVALTLDTI